MSLLQTDNCRFGGIVDDKKTCNRRRIIRALKARHHNALCPFYRAFGALAALSNVFLTSSELS
jgi:hypothetical protein